jgi:hypothetical protein
VGSRNDGRIRLRIVIPTGEMNLLFLLKFLCKNPNARTTVRAYLFVFIIQRAHTVRKGDSA